MKKRWILLSAFCTGAITYAQVGIGTGTPNLSAQLEISSDKRGVLIPQVPLKGVLDAKTIENGNVESLLVYNITTNNELQPGYYYWKGASWHRLLTDLDSKEWEFPGNKSFVVEDGVLKLYDTDDNFIFIEIEHLNIVTTLVKDADGNGQYTYTNEEGTAVVIDVQADVINNFEEIINNTEVQEILNQVINNIGGNVSYDGSDFTYVNENGHTVIIDIEAIVKANETITTLVKDADGNGQYTYTNEEGTAVVIDVQADVINNFEEIINNTEVQEILNQVINNIGGNVSYDGSDFTYVNENGHTVIIDIEAIVKANETITTLVKDADGNGQYTYTNEEGTAVVIDVQADVINNFEEIINNTEVQEILNQVINNIGGNVSYDGSNFTYVNENGDTVIIDMESIVKANETLTKLVNVETTETSEEGEVTKTYSLTYTDEKGIENPIDIEVLVKGNETITTLVYDPAVNSLYYTNEIGEVTELKLQELVVGGESLTKLEFDASNNTLLYTDENGVIHTIEIDSINKHPWLDSTTHKLATSPTSNIYTKGWVGIGFTEPSTAPSEKLRVNGSITAVNSYYADYVFENYFDGFSSLKYDYNFKSLDVVEDFIKENRHLPGITPIHQLTKSEEGYAFNVSELSIQLLEKTEELYLHIIDQNKELEEKEARIKELEQANQHVQQKVEQLEQMLLEFMQKN